MTINALNLDAITAQHKTKLVDVPQFGGSVMMTQLTVAGCVRQNSLYVAISQMKDITDERRIGLTICADIMSAMVCPDTGNFLLREDQLERFNSVLTKETFEALLLANSELNPVKKEFLTLEEKKSGS